MGTDIYSDKGVIASVEDLVKVINGKNKKDVVSICQCMYQKILNLKDNGSWFAEAAEHFSPLATLSPTMKINDIRALLVSLVVVNGEPAKYNTDIEVAFADYIKELWDDIINHCAPILPELKYVQAFGSSRYNGWEVPLGEACFIFDSEECYIKTLSEQGQQLKKLIGHCDETEWTEISY